VRPEIGLDFVLNPKMLGSGLYIINVYCLPHVLIYFPIRYVALKVLENPSEKYQSKGLQAGTPFPAAIFAAEKYAL
jgi:hypothetical protein